MRWYEHANVDVCQLESLELNVACVWLTGLQSRDPAASPQPLRCLTPLWGLGTEYTKTLDCNLTTSKDRHLAVITSNRQDSGNCSIIAVAGMKIDSSHAIARESCEICSGAV